MLQHIQIVWRPVRNGSYVGLLGDHEIAYVFQPDGDVAWKWRISSCNGTSSCEFEFAETLAEARAAVEAGVLAWFRRAGLLQSP